MIQKKTAFPRELLGVVGLLDLARHAPGMCASVCVCVFVCVCEHVCSLNLIPLHHQLLYALGYEALQ